MTTIRIWLNDENDDHFKYKVDATVAKYIIDKLEAVDLEQKFNGSLDDLCNSIYKEFLPIK